MRLVDLQKLGLTAQTYSISATDNTQQTLNTGIVTLKRPFGIMINNIAFAPGEYLTGYSWDLSANLAPRVTLNFSSSITRDAEVTVLYQL